MTEENGKTQLDHVHLFLHQMLVYNIKQAVIVESLGISCTPHNNWISTTSPAKLILKLTNVGTEACVVNNCEKERKDCRLTLPASGEETVTLSRRMVKSAVQIDHKCLLL